MQQALQGICKRNPYYLKMEAEKALRRAARLGDLYTVTRLAELLSSAKTPALLHAAQHGQLAVVKALIQLGTDSSNTDRHGRTALAWAAYGGNLKVS